MFDLESRSRRTSVIYTCLNGNETCRWDLPQVKVHHYFLGEDSLVQAPGLKRPAHSSLSHCPTTNMAGLEQDYARVVRSIEARLEGCKAAMQTALSKEQHEELTEEVEAVSELLFVQLGKLRTNLEKTLHGELDEFYDQKIPELVELRRSLTKVLIVDEIEAEREKFSEEVNLEPAYKSGYAVLSSHTEIEAEGVKFSEEVYKQSTTDYVR